MDFEIRFHSQIQGFFQGFDEVFAAVGIAAVVCLADSCDDVFDLQIVGIKCGNGNEKMVAAGDEGVWEFLLVGLRDFLVMVNQGVVLELFKQL